MSEQGKFETWLEAARADGLVDIKFFFHPSKAVEPGEIYKGLNEIEEAISRGDCVRHSGWKGNEAA
ncbi:MAG: hypothetical protein KAG89_07840 [Fulvimarina manganoxydans]|uniref:hypothetical protein n=1 Tax=Fulvimarina manganoxydans TaxID=937218 RepID=UPI002354A4D9|nr:hypothetical protein [Fulvimarina manganoxydans]MCK5932070.1 hypothetical protein [Fulvimarina manganoxydans]